MGLFLFTDNMKFKIDFKPYPGAPYFTVQEHQRSYDSGVTENPEEYLKGAEKHLRRLFNIPSDFGFDMVALSMKNNLLAQTVTQIVKDDPQTGIEFSSESKLMLSSPGLLDLSYSFPQIQNIVEEYDYILIDPNASLGIPVGFLVVFSKNRLTKSNNLFNIQSHKNEIFLLNKVLLDYTEKGIETLLRESNYKAALLHHMIETSNYLSPVGEKKFRSKTMIIAECDPEFLVKIKKMGYEVGVQKNGEKLLITIANYPTNSKELVEMFSDRVGVF